MRRKNSYGLRKRESESRIMNPSDDAPYTVSAEKYGQGITYYDRELCCGTGLKERRAARLS